MFFSFEPQTNIRKEEVTFAISIVLFVTIVSGAVCFGYLPKNSSRSNGRDGRGGHHFIFLAPGLALDGKSYSFMFVGLESDNVNITPRILK